MMNQISRISRRSGFTLIELVIVLGITGLIFSGLWGLLTSGSSQLQAQSAAQQYRQVMEATRQYVLGGTDASLNSAGLHTVTIANLIAASLLPASFPTTDAFGGTITIAVNTIDSSKQRYQFSAYSNGTTIPDKAGAQIASLIGSEGGFVYANPTDGCAATAAIAATTACGSFNSFALLLSTMGIANGAGKIVTLSYTTDTNTGTAPWLYRKSGYSVEQRTMQDNMFFTSGSALTLAMQGNALSMGSGLLTSGGGTLSMGATATSTTAGGTLNMSAGSITNLQDLSGANSSLTFTSLTVKANTSIDYYPNQSGGANTFNVWGTAPDTVIFAIQNGAGRADTFQAGKFIYSSDLSMKENLLPITNALQKVLMLHGFNYDWKGTKGHDVGLVAQDVQKVFPELVTTTQGGKLGIDYAKIIAPVIEAIRQLKSENDDLKQKVEELKKQLDHK